LLSFIWRGPSKRIEERICIQEGAVERVLNNARRLPTPVVPLGTLPEDLRMKPRSYTLLAAVIFAIIAVLQLMRGILGWPVMVETAWATLSIPLWPSWVACAAGAVLAWLGFTTARKL
jgi:hypothetical protein